MRIRVRVRDEVIMVECGAGEQRVKWLAMVALQRYEGEAGVRLSHRHVATALTAPDGSALASNKIISRVLLDGDEVVVRVQEDDMRALGTAGALMPLGTSSFLISQGASAVRCTLSGRGTGHVLAQQVTHLFIIARDTYGNLTRNGGDHFTLRAEGPGAVTSNVRDLGDGSYLASFTCAVVGRYTIFCELDGLNIDGSPFQTIATRPPHIVRLKWSQPTLTGAPPHALACAVSIAIGRRVLVFGGTAGGDRRPTNAIQVLHTDRMKWSEAAALDGPSPPPCFAAASALVGTRLFVFGGEAGEGLDPSTAPLSSLWVFDVGTTTWALCEPLGVKPGARSFAAAAAVGNTLYIFGGWTGSGVTASLHTLHTSSPLPRWEPAHVSSASAAVLPRMGHTMVAIGERLFVYGGRGADAGAAAPGSQRAEAGAAGGESVADGVPPQSPGSPASIYADLLLFDPTFQGGGMWSVVKTTAEVPRERWLHSCVTLGESLIIFGGYDSSGESTAFSILNTNSLKWDSWDASAGRAGGCMHLVEGRVVVIGGVENGRACDDVLATNLGGFQLEFDGERDEVMVPHPASLLPAAYTIEAWIMPARSFAPMNIACRSSEAYPQAVWSHQLRLSERGTLQHATLLANGERVIVESNSQIKAGVWTHVAGSASSNGSISLFVNGSADDVPDRPLDGALNTQLDRMFIGARSGESMGPFHGSITELRLWNVARSAEAIREEMRRHLKGSEPGLVGYWKLNEGPGGTIFDSTVAGNHGPLMGNPTWDAAKSPMAAK